MREAGGGMRPRWPGNKKTAPAMQRTPFLRPTYGLSDFGGFHFFRLAQNIAAAPDGLDIIVAAASQRQLLAQFADEDVDDLELGLVHAAVKVVEEHLLGQGRALAKGEELQHRIFLAG